MAGFDCFDKLIQFLYYLVCVCTAGLSIWFRPYVYVYVCVCMTQKCLFRILLAINRRQGLFTACSQDLYVTKVAFDT